MRAVLTFAAMLPLLTTGPAGAQQEAPREERLRGRVVAGAAGTGVAGARVELVQIRGGRRRVGARRAAPRPPGAAPTSRTLSRTLTDAAGAFVLPLPKERVRLGLFVRAEGFVRQFMPVPLRPSGPLEVIIQPARTLRGKLVDAATGRPLAGGRVRYQERSAETGASGVFVLEGLPQEFGDGAVEMAAAGYATVLLTDPFGGAGPLVVRLERAAHLLVAVVDEHDAPLEGARVRARQPFAPPYSAAERRDVTGATGADGRVTLDGLPPRAAFVVEATSAGGVTTQSPVVTPVPAGEARDPLTLRLADGFRVAVRVIDGHGSALAGADVRLLPLCERRQAFGGFSESDNSRGAHRFGRTDARGRLRFERVPPAPITCEVRAPRMQTVLTVLHPGAAGAPVREAVLRLEHDADPPGTQIPWGPGVAWGFERATRDHLPLMIQMTMDGERANDWIAGHHFKDPEVVRVARRIPILLASAFGPGGLSAPGVEHGVEHGVSTRYGAVHPRVYQAVEVWARETFLGAGSFQVPREILVTPGGRVLTHRFYYLTERDLVRVMLQGARFMQKDLPLELARPRLGGLRAGLVSLDGTVREGAVRDLLLLANSGDEHARALLDDLGGVPASDRLRILQGLVLAAFDFPATALRGFAQDPDPRVRASAYARLGGLLPDPDALELLAGRLLEQDRAARAALLAACGIEPGSRVREAAQSRRWRLIEALVRAGLAPSAEALRRDLEQIDREGCNRILRAVAEKAPPRLFLELAGATSLDGPEAAGVLMALEKLLPRLEDPDRIEEARTLLRLALDSGEPLLREAAAQALAVDDGTGQLGLLRQRLGDTSRYVRFQAARSLLLRHDHSGLEVLLEALEWGAVADEARRLLRGLAREAVPATPWQWRRWLRDRGLLAESGQKGEDG